MLPRCLQLRGSWCISNLKKQLDNLEEPVPVDLEGFGEETYDTLCERVYPVYSKASMRLHNDLHANDEVPKEEYDAGLKVLNNALAAERMRNEEIWGGAGARTLCRRKWVWALCPAIHRTCGH
jgi:hypothetical protein